MDDNVFYLSEKNGETPKNWNGHNTSTIHSNGNGHYDGDGCIPNPVSVDKWVHIFIFIAVSVILATRK